MDHKIPISIFVAFFIMLSGAQAQGFCNDDGYCAPDFEDASTCPGDCVFELIDTGCVIDSSDPGHAEYICNLTNFINTLDQLEDLRVVLESEAHFASSDAQVNIDCAELQLSYLTCAPCEEQVSNGLYEAICIGYDTTYVMTDCAEGCVDGHCIGSQDVACGDRVCNGDENFGTCPQDCADRCGDGYCNVETETSANCPQDCGAGGCLEDADCQDGEVCFEDTCYPSFECIEGSCYVDTGCSVEEFACIDNQCPPVLGCGVMMLPNGCQGEDCDGDGCPYSCDPDDCDASLTGPECSPDCGDSCPHFALPYCPDGRIVAGDMDECGCQGPSTCCPDTCPRYSPPYCPDGTLVVGEVDECGCRGTPVCVPEGETR